MDKIGKNDLLRVTPHPPLPMPRSARALFELLSHYDSREGLDGLIQRLDLTNAKRSDIYRLAHQRAPGLIRDTSPGPDFDPHEAVLEALLSDEYRRNLLRNLLMSYPEKRRDVYFHVPKCAGTDLTLNLAPRRASLPALIHENGSNEEALIYISHLCRSLRMSDDIFIYGHIEFGRYIDQVGVRPGDRFFTVIRDPIELMISQVSDALSQVLRDPEGESADPKMFLGFLGLDRLPPDPSPGYLKSLWVRGLLDQRIAQPNRICTHLGREGKATYEVAMTDMVTHDVEITTVGNYSQWLRDRWSLSVNTRHNASERYLYPGEVKRHLLERIWPSIVEDDKFYRVVQWALCKSGQISITGQQIYELAGSQLMDELPERLMNDPGAVMSGMHPEPGNLVAVQQLSQIARFLAPFPAELNQSPRECLLEVDFGEKGNGALFTGTGWAAPEREFTWTNANEATLKLPCPDKQLSFQAMVLPFRQTEKVPVQSIELLVNGAGVARGAMKGPALLECDVPRSLVEAGSSLELTFRFVNATRPVDVGSSQDQRLLGAAFRWAKLFAAVG